MKNFFVSWWANPDFGVFKLAHPWWISAPRSEQSVAISASIIANDAETAKQMIYAAYAVRPQNIEFRCCEED